MKSVFGFRVRLGNPDLDFENLNPDFPIERTLRVYILKQLFFSILVNSGFGNIYLAAFAARQVFSHYSPRLPRIIVKY